MIKNDDFREGVECGALGVIDMITTRLYYMPSTWREGDGAYIIDIIEHTIESARKIYIKGGADNGEES